jgi:hypothetical protein
MTSGATIGALNEEGLEWDSGHPCNREMVAMIGNGNVMEVGSAAVLR